MCMHWLYCSGVGADLSGQYTSVACFRQSRSLVSTTSQGVESYVLGTFRAVQAMTTGMAE